MTLTTITFKTILFESHKFKLIYKSEQTNSKPLQNYDMKLVYGKLELKCKKSTNII